MSIRQVSLRRSTSSIAVWPAAAVLLQQLLLL